MSTICHKSYDKHAIEPKSVHFKGKKLSFFGQTQGF